MKELKLYGNVLVKAGNKNIKAFKSNQKYLILKNNIYENCEMHSIFRGDYN